MCNRHAFGLVAVAIFAAAALGVADDWPQWRGPERNGVSREVGWLTDWPVGSVPRVAWRASVGKGHASVTVSQGRAYTVGWDGRRDTVFCFDAANGTLRWKQSYACSSIGQWPGPRATPSVDGDSVYTLGQHGQLRAWEAGSGKRRWQVQLAASYNPDVDYGFAWSPLVVGDLLILGAGSGGLALRTPDGSFAWGNDGQHGACASAVPYRHQDRRAVVVLTTNPGRKSIRMVGVDPRTGRKLWQSEPWPEQWGAACVDVVAHEGHFFLTTAEQYKRCARFTLRDGQLRQDWSNPRLSIYTGAPVLLDGALYAVDKTGILKCLDWKTGEERWAQRGFDSTGSLIAADGKLMVQAGRSGNLVVAAALPAGYRELRRAKVFTGKPDTFTPPVLANGRIYCRSYAGEIVCLATGKPED